ARMSMGRVALCSATFSFWLALGAACGDSSSNCTPGESSPCTCANAASGAQVCDDDGSKYGACACGGGPGGPGNAQNGGSGGSPGGQLVEYGQGEYGITLSSPPPGTYCWYIEETVRICGTSQDTNARNICYENEPNCLVRQPEDSETDTGSCWTRV